MRMRLQSGQLGAQNFGGRGDAIEKFLGLEAIEDGVACGGRNWMGLIGEAMLEGAAAAFEGRGNARRNQDGAERRVPTGDSLPDQDEVGFNIPVLDGEWYSGAAHAAHNFVGDQQNAPAAADFSDALGVAFWRNGGAERCADNGLEEESGCGIGVVAFEKRFQVAGASDAAFGKFLIERTVIAEARSDVSPFSKQRLIGRAARDVAADGHGAESAAVIALTARDDAITG